MWDHIEAETKWMAFLRQFWSAFSWIKIFEFPIKISLKFVPKGPINNIPALIEIMAWRRPGDKPLSELMMISLPVSLRLNELIKLRYIPSFTLVGWDAQILL